MSNDSFTAQIDRDEKTGKVEYQVQHKMDVGPMLRSAEVMRAREEVALRKNDQWRPQARLDWVTVMNIKQKYGIDATNVKPDQEQRFWQIVQSEYPKMLTTSKKVYRRQKIKFDRGTLEPAK